nr:Transposon Ty3-G Gag-Pol polyprotein [Ipomoea batatas]
MRCCPPKKLDFNANGRTNSNPSWLPWKQRQRLTLRRLKQCMSKSWKPPHHTLNDDLYSGQILGLPSPLMKDLLIETPLYRNTVTIRPTPNSQPSGILSGGTSGQKFLLVPHALSTPALPIRKFTVAEIRDRRDKGLYFHCDQKYSQGHRCKSRFLLLIGDEEEPNMDAELVVSKEDPTSMEFIAGNWEHHNFINPDIMEKLQLPTKAIKPFKVYIGNGDTLGCQHVCPNVEICMQGNSFTIDLQVLSMVGPDVIRRRTQLRRRRLAFAAELVVAVFAEAEVAAITVAEPVATAAERNRRRSRELFAVTFAAVSRVAVAPPSPSQ